VPDPIVSPDSDNLKYCSACGELKPREAFSRASSRKDGLQRHCKKCRAAITHDWYINNKEHVKEVESRWREANPDYRHLYNISHREEFRERLRKRSATEPEYLANRRANRKKHRDTARKCLRVWRAANPEKTRSYDHNRRAREAGNGGTYTIEELAAVRAAQTDKQGRLLCWECGKPIKGTPHLDHWIPIAKGGRNDAGNLHYMHARCNLKKNAKHPTELGRLV
jgi:hypothetical protein